MRTKTAVMAACAAILLTGCNIEMASFAIRGNDIALTMVRTQPYFWSSGWELELIIRNNPECQRRHDLKETAGNNLKVDLYVPAPGAFILRQNKRWYVAELKSCGFEPYKEAPPEPGELLGSFQEKDGVFKFVENAKGKAAKE